MYRNSKTCSKSFPTPTHQSLGKAMTVYFMTRTLKKHWMLAKFLLRMSFFSASNSTSVVSVCCIGCHPISTGFRSLCSLSRWLQTPQSWTAAVLSERQDTCSQNFVSLSLKPHSSTARMEIEGCSKDFIAFSCIWTVRENNVTNKTKIYETEKNTSCGSWYLSTGSWEKYHVALSCLQS